MWKWTDWSTTKQTFLIWASCKPGVFLFKTLLAKGNLTAPHDVPSCPSVGSYNMYGPWHCNHICFGGNSTAITTFVTGFCILHKDWPFQWPLSFGEAKPQSPQQQTSPRRPVDSSETWNFVVSLPTKETAILRKKLKLEADSDQFAVPIR